MRDGGHRVPPHTLRRARELRHPQTPPEAALWSRIRSGQVAGLKFRRQHPLGRFIVDFCCPARRLVVELDGDSHADQAAYDANRTTWLTARGYGVVRFTNREVEQNLGGVLEAILAECERPR